MKVAIYARVSTDSDEQAQALEQQLARLRRKAAELGDPHPQEYVDVDSGSNDERTKLNQLLSDCETGLLSAVIVTRLDRLSRSSSHGAMLLRRFKSDEFPTLIALDDGIDLGTTGGGFFANLLINWAEAESERLAERTKHGFAHRRKLLKPCGSKPLFAYQFNADRSRYEPDPDRFHIAQEAVERFLANPNTSALVDWFWKEHGIRWAHNYSLRRWMSNPTIAGARVYGQQIRKVDSNGKKKRIDHPPGVFDQIIWTDEDGQPFQKPLVTQVELARIHAVFAARSEPSRRELRDGRTRVLTGLVKCGECGNSLHYHQPYKGATYWTMRCIGIGCTQRYKTLRVDGIERAMVSRLASYAFELAKDLDGIRKAQANSLSTEQKALQEKIDQLIQMDDPDLKEAIDKKRKELDLLATGENISGCEIFIGQSAELKTYLTGEINPKEIRSLLKRYCTCETLNQEVRQIKLAAHIRRPGEDGIIDLHGQGLGRAPSRKGEKLNVSLERTIKDLENAGMNREEAIKRLAENKISKL